MRLMSRMYAHLSLVCQEPDYSLEISGSHTCTCKFQKSDGAYEHAPTRFYMGLKTLLSLSWALSGQRIRKLWVVIHFYILTVA